MKLSKVLIIAAIAVSLIFVMGACGLVDNLSTFKEDQNNPDGNTQDQQTGDAKDEDTNKADEQTVEQDLNLTEDPDKTDENKDQETISGETNEVVLYFATSDGTSLKSETRAIPKQEGLARATINQLIAGPKSEELLPTLPAATILEDINIAGGICTVDFSSDLLTDMSDDQSAQMLALYSIVNTLTQFDSVDYVRILVNGQAIESLAGVDASTVIAPYNW